MIEFITGAAGSGKSTRMTDNISQQADMGKEICIIVPEQFSYEFDKKLYKKIGAEKFNKLISLSFTGFARHLFQIYGDSCRNGDYADETARMIMIYEAVSAFQKNPESNGYFRRQSSRPGFAEEILKLIEEMKKSGITPKLLLEKSAFLDKKLMDKTADVAMIYLEYERLLNQYGFKDKFDDIKEAAKIANLNRYFADKSVFIDEFESFTGDQLELIKVILADAENVCISLRTDDVNAGEYTLFETVNSTYRKLKGICRELGKSCILSQCSGSYRFKNSDIAYLSSNILRNTAAEPKKAPAPENIKIFEAKDYYSECEYVCAAIKRLIFSDRTLRYNDIAVISNNIEAYSEVLKAAMERYEIPCFLSIEKPVMHTVIMIFFSSLLDIISKREFNSELIFRCMKCGLLDISLTDISLLENYCYKWGIDGELWEQSFTADDIHLEKLEQIRRSFIEPVIKLKRRLSKNLPANRFCMYLYEYLCRCGAEKNLARTMGRLIKANKDNEAAELKRLWSCLIDILDSVSDTLDDKEISASEISRIIKSLIGRINYSVPPQTLDSITAASARTARLNSPRVIFVMGANDGDFPNTVNTHGIFSETDKQQLADNGIEISRRLQDLIASERLVVYKSLSAASEKIFVTYPLSDLSGQAKYSAPVIDGIINLFGNNDIRITEAQLSPDYYAVTMKSAFYHYMQDIKRCDSSTAVLKKLLMEDIEYRRRLDYTLNRSAQHEKYTVSTDIMEQLMFFEPLKISPSAFELYNKCHFQYFCQECLRLYKREKVVLDRRYSGSIIHRCFYSIISNHSKEDFINLSYDELKAEIKKSSEKFVEEEMGGDFAKNPRFELGFRKLSDRLVRIFIHTQQELMASSFTPESFELNLRDKEINSEIELSFGSGKSLSFGGIVDRADTCIIGDEKYVRIIDYKSSKKKIDTYKLSNGINMQMLLYLFAITQQGGCYSDCKPAGVLYSPVTISTVKANDSRSDTENLSAINSGLKSDGLVLGNRNVLEAMESGIAGKYIPVNLDKNNDIDKNSSCISLAGFEKLRKYAYRKLREMAESVYSGDASAVPLYFKSEDNGCLYCPYTGVCGNYPPVRIRNAYSNDTSEIDEILDMKEECDNEMD